jgi:hypothetical protein
MCAVFIFRAPRLTNTASFGNRRKLTVTLNAFRYRTQVHQLNTELNWP